MTETWAKAGDTAPENQKAAIHCKFKPMQTLTSTIMIYKPNQTWSYWQPFPQSRKQGLADDQQGWMATNIKPDQINNLFADKEKTYHDRCINNSQASDPFYTEIGVDNTILCIARGHRTRPGRMRRGNCVFTKVCIQLFVGSCFWRRLTTCDNIIFPCGRWKEALGRSYTFAVGENVKFRGKKVWIDLWGIKRIRARYSNGSAWEEL